MTHGSTRGGWVGSGRGPPPPTRHYFRALQRQTCPFFFYIWGAKNLYYIRHSFASPRSLIFITISTRSAKFTDVSDNRSLILPFRETKKIANGHLILSFELTRPFAIIPSRLSLPVTFYRFGNHECIIFGIVS